LDDADQLQKELELLQSQTNRMENQVAQMQDKLKTRKEKRILEASLTNMSPEERADHVMQQEQQQEKTPDLDIIL
jgi:hypothetical protein